jgi:hypothetical protein
MDENRQEILISAEGLVRTSKELLQHAVDTLPTASEMLLDILDELDDEELGAILPSLVGVSGGLKVLLENLQELVAEEVKAVERIKARGLKTSSVDQRLDKLRREWGITREQMSVREQTPSSLRRGLAAVWSTWKG